MFIYSRAVLFKISEDIKKFAFIFSLLTQIIYIGYLVYALIAGSGIFYANIILLVLSYTYSVFIVINRIKQSKKPEDSEKNVKKIYRRAKICINALTLGATLYGIFIATSSPDTASVIFASFTTITWLLSVLLEIVVVIFEKYSELVAAAIEKDLYQFKKWIPGTDAPEIKEKVNRKIETLGGAYESKLDAEKLLRKAEKKARNQEKRKEFRAAVTQKIRGLLPKKKAIPTDSRDEKSETVSSGGKKQP